MNELLGDEGPVRARRSASRCLLCTDEVLAANDAVGVDAFTEDGSGVLNSLEARADWDTSAGELDVSPTDPVPE